MVQGQGWYRVEGRVGSGVVQGQRWCRVEGRVGPGVHQYNLHRCEPRLRNRGKKVMGRQERVCILGKVKAMG